MAISILNQSSCGTTANVGQAGCGFTPALTKYACLIPKGFVIPESAMASAAAFNIYIQARLYDNNRNAQFYLTPLLTNFTDKTAAVKEENRDENMKRTFIPNYQFSFLMNDDLCNFLNWRKFDLSQSQFDVLLVDANSSWCGRKGLDATGANGLGGYAMFEINIDPWRLATVSAAAHYPLMLKFQDWKQMNDNFSFITANTDMGSLQGLIDVTLVATQISNAVNAHIKAAGFVGCASDFASTYNSLTSASFVVTDTTTNTVKTITSVTFVPGTNLAGPYYDLLISGVLTATDVINVKLALPSVNIALGYNITTVNNATFIAV